jgi:hypothetical protein
MKFIVKAIVYGFAFTLGAALFKKIQHQIGLGDPNAQATPQPIKPDGASDSNLQHQYT